MSLWRRLRGQSAFAKRDRVMRVLLRGEQRELSTRERMRRSGLLVPAPGLEVRPVSGRMRQRKRGGARPMERSPSPADKVLTHAAAQATETDPVLSELDAVLDAEATSGEVLLRLLLVKYLYDWSEQQIAEQGEDSLVLRWFCRLGLQPAPAISSVSQAAGLVSVTELEALANRVEQARERAKESEGRLRPTYRQRWR